jgi:hypothetical protein
MEDLINDLNGTGFQKTSAHRAVALVGQILDTLTPVYCYSKGHQSSEIVNGNTWMSQTDPSSWKEGVPLRYIEEYEETWDYTNIPDYYTMVGQSGCSGISYTRVKEGTVTSVDGEWVYDITEKEEMRDAPNWCFWPHVEVILGEDWEVAEDGAIVITDFARVRSRLKELVKVITVEVSDV